MISVDVMDVIGEQQLDVDHDVLKRRVDANLRPISPVVEKETGTVISVVARVCVL